MNGAEHYSIPKEPGGLSAAALAAAVHVCLIAFLWIGVSWQTQKPGGVEAEVWDLQYREAAPKVASQPGPEPKQEHPEQQEPRAVVNKTPPPPVTKAVKAPEIKHQVARPDIALEQEKKRKKEAELKKKAEDDRRRQESEKKLAEDKRKKLEAEKLARREKEKADAAARKKQELADQKYRDKMRAEEMRRMAGAIGSGTGRGGTGGRGTAVRSTGNNRLDPSYGSKISAKIKSNTNYVVPAGVSGNPEVVYVVELLPDGSLRRPPRKKKSSGLPGFDEAVFRAIEKSVPFPRDSKGEVPKELEIAHKPKDK